MYAVKLLGFLTLFGVFSSGGERAVLQGCQQLVFPYNSSPPHH